MRKKEEEEEPNPCNCPSAIAQISAGNKKKAVVACREVVLVVDKDGNWKDALCPLCGGRILLRTEPVLFQEFCKNPI